MKRFVYSLIYLVSILILLDACTTSSLISSNEANELNVCHDYLILHTKNDKYKLYQYVFSDSTLKGHLYKMTKVKGIRLNVYTSITDELSTSELNVKDFEIKKSEIIKITTSKINVPLTIITSAIGAYAGLMFFTFVTMLISGGYDM